MGVDLVLLYKTTVNPGKQGSFAVFLFDVKKLKKFRASGNLVYGERKYLKMLFQAVKEVFREFREARRKARR